ncbi:HAD family hydrolase [Salipaludibacillus agaradhaerens]|uniref:HAD family hydrolase n=1 Tax=Salipaludibacillus agaradhaerens TaxID=76935 RepID=A0A9Q4B0D6_SALAG|nr:HAD family hydrolase [Salipaludibacillus agaradhaerens]MCR6114745.1 HAD family hydrolase [Salipaludibacillus agaradhaerens]
MEKRVYIFDLDGTLYEGSDHFDFYADRLLADVPEEFKEAFQQDYINMKDGRHNVMIGKAYDVIRDIVITVDPMTLQAIEAKTWEGKVRPEMLSYYGDSPLNFDFKNIVAIGDGWWLPFACAKHYGVKDCYTHYLETKAYMVSDSFNLQKIFGLKTFLKELKQNHPLVLMTNSDKEDVLRLLNELDLKGIFDHIISSAKKPTLTTQLFEALKKQYELPFQQLVSVGDNFINEIAPALMLDMKAVYISSHPHQTAHANLCHVQQISEWINSDWEIYK